METISWCSMRHLMHIYTNDIYCERLEIPNNFCGHQIDKNILAQFILSATKEMFTIEIEMDNGIFYLGKGLVNFLVENNIQSGFCIVFKKLRKWVFKVKIFGRSCLQIIRSRSDPTHVIFTKKFVRTFNIQAGRILTLKLPKKFSLIYGNELEDPITVSTHDKDTVLINLQSKHNRIYLVEGLNRLLERNCIGDKYCLIFNYTHRSTFSVKIFNTSGFEVRDFPQPTRHNYPISGRPIHGVPTFTVQVESSKKLKYRIWVPYRFSTIFLPHKPSVAHIQDIDYQIWNCKTWQNKCTGQVQALTTGWLSYYQAKNIHHKDVLMFELITNSPTTFVVYKYVYPTGKLIVT